jgi:hypothetical protein
MFATKVMLFLAVAMVDGSKVDGAGRRLCEDEHDPDPSCGVTTNKTLNAKAQCAFVVTVTQLSVERPRIQDANVGHQCNRTVEGRVHDDVCEMCGKEHNPCGNKFTSCRGCCASPSKHVPLREQSCPLIKKYFSREEAREGCKVNLRPPINGEILDKEPDVVEKVGTTDKDEAFFKKTLEVDCDVDVGQYNCPKVPAKVDFECNQCNKGSPRLLKECCDECVRFAQSSKLANLTDILPFVVCSGCDTEIIFMPSRDPKKAAQETDPDTKYWESWVSNGGETMTWYAAGGYQNYSETVAQANMDRWIEANICKAFEPETCDDREYPRNRRLLHSRDGHDQTNFSFEQCRRQQEVQAFSTSMPDEALKIDAQGSTTTPSKTTGTNPVAAKVVAGVNATPSDDRDTSGSGSVSVLVAMAVMACSVVFV